MKEDNTQEDQKQQEAKGKQGGFTISSQDLDLAPSQEALRIGDQTASPQQQALSATPVLPPWPKTPAICLPIGLGHALVGSLVGILFGSITKIIAAPKAAFASPKLIFSAASTSAKSFAILSAVYGTSLCYVQKFRNKEDIANCTVAGCASGFILGFGQGIIGASTGCATFATLSYFTEKYFGVMGKAGAYELPPTTKVEATRDIRSILTPAMPFI